MVYGTPEFAQLLKQVMKDGLRHDLYEMTCDHARDMAVHINGEKPMYLLEKARPREDEEVKIYRIDNYEPTTKAGADRAIKIVSKGFNPNLYSITFTDKSKEAEELERYTLEEYPIFNSIINFNKDVLLRKMLADANGVVAVKPEDVPDDDTEEMQPVTVVYGSSCVWYYDRDHFLICLKEPTRDIERDEDKLFLFDYYDRTQYIQFEAYYDNSEKEVVINELFGPAKHQAKKIPAWFLGGESKNLDNGKILFQSFFSAALPHWNLAVKHGSDLMASIVGHIFPQKYEVAEECAYSEMHDGMSFSCRGGQLSYLDDNKKRVERQCPQCQGSGLVAVRGPLQTYQFLKEKLIEGNGINVPPVGYIDVPIDATKFLDDYTDKMDQKAMAAINMDIEEKVGENQSGIAKVIDRTAQNDTLFDIHTRMFDVHLNNEYYFINAYKFGTKTLSVPGKEPVKKNLPEVNKPTKFDLLSTAELINNFNVAKTSGLDRNVLRVKAIEIINSDMGSTPHLKNYLIAIIELDPLYAFTVDEIDLGVTKGVIKKSDWALHDNIKAFIDRALETDKEFLAKSKADKLKVLEGFANELIASEKPKIDEAEMFVDQNQNAA